MSDQPSEKKSACPHPEAVGTRWGDPISEERQAELRALSDKQREWAAQPATKRGDSPFKGVKLTGADVDWLAEASGRGQNNEVPNLHLEGANLVGAHLEGADLSGAQLEEANLFGAQLKGTNLRMRT